MYARLLVQSKAITRARFAALALLVVLVWHGAPAAAAEKHALLGLPVPDLVARGLSGENVRISEHRGEVVIVSFWSGSCNTCRAQLEALDRIARTYGSAGLVVIGVNLDDTSARRRSSRVPRMWIFSCWFDRKSTGRDFGIDRLPMVLFLDRAGVLRVAAHANSKPVTKPNTCASAQTLDE